MSAVDGAIAWAMQVLDAASAAVVDMTTGATLGAAGDPALHAESVSAAGTAMVLAGLHVSRRVGASDGTGDGTGGGGSSPAGPPEDLLVCAGRWFHLIRPVYAGDQPIAFVHVLLDRSRTNLALARRELAQLTATSLADVVAASAGPVGTGEPADGPAPVPERRTPESWLAGPAAGRAADPAADPAVLPRRRPNTTWPGGRPVDADPRYAAAGVAILDQVVREPVAPLDGTTMRRLAAALRRL